MVSASNDSSAPLYFQLNDAGTYFPRSGKSHYFNVSLTATPNPEPQAGKRLSKKSIAGISTGATIGGLLVLGGLGFLAWRQGIWSSASSNGPFTSDKQAATPQNNAAEFPADNGRAELPENSKGAELPAGCRIKDQGVETHLGGYGGLHELPS